MPYTTLNDLEDAAGGAHKLVELADRDNDNVADAALLARVQLLVDDWVDLHLRKFSPADLTALRATPSPVIARIAARELVFQLKSDLPAGVSDADFKLREDREKQLQGIRADDLRAKDVKSPRAVFVENCGDVTKKNTGGMW